MPGVIRGKILILPATAAAFWPVWHWYLSRLSDGSDEPWGVLALFTALILLLREGRPVSKALIGAPTLIMLAVYALSFHWTPAIMRAALAALVPLIPLGALSNPSPITFTDWPSHFEGKALKPLPLTKREERFQSGFPGRIGRFTDGHREIIIRWVNQPTRKLHPAADCFRGSGYKIEHLSLVQEEEGVWSSFKASQDGEDLIVKERIFNHHAHSWPDVSSWYWTATLRSDAGPWWAITVAQATESQKIIVPAPFR